MNQITNIAVHTTGRKYDYRNQAPATADIIVNLVISRATYNTINIKKSQFPVLWARGAWGQAQAFILPVPLPKLLCPLP